MRENFLRSQEFAPVLEQIAAQRILETQSLTPLDIYTGCSTQDYELIRERFAREVQPEAGFVVDRLGVRTRISSLWNEVQHLNGTVLAVPIPSDFHAEAIEWAGMLKAVRSARSSFRMMEAGAGWGPWAVASAVAARNAGITDISLMAIEADPGHFSFLRQHLLDNGFDPEKHRLLRKAVGVEQSVARWPVVDSHNDWGARPISEAGDDGSAVDYRGKEFTDTMEIEVAPFASLLTMEPRWDLVHMDVQGEEGIICQATAKQFDERVHWFVVGTHTRLVEGQLLETFAGMGWRLENEKPSRLQVGSDARRAESFLVTDGTQVWRNPKLE
jgi:FkbM family methyltransferase